MQIDFNLIGPKETLVSSVSIEQVPYQQTNTGI